MLIEIMGPAAVGKSTLVRELCARDESVSAGIGLAKLAYVGPTARRLGAFLAVWLRLRPRGRWLDRREMRSVARLETWSRAIARTRIGPASVVVFDHGPWYRLARLRAFGPALTKTEPFVRWWQDSLARWSEHLDIVVMLDAADDVLLRRVDDRGHWFLGRDIPPADKVRFLARYREAFDEVVDDAADGPTIVRLRADEMSAGALATEVFA
ncbi:MAG TPA: hypothetical protein VNC60_04495, partial [Actinomycetota bacterium]|nr:hypothetical protein [Actinomycetota bacterium]